MRKIILLWLLAVLPYASIHAVDVYFYNGSDIIPMTSVYNVQKIVFNDETLEIVSTDGVHATVGIEDFEYFKFYDTTPVKVVEVSSQTEEQVVFSLSGSMLHISANSAINAVELFSCNGQKISTLTCEDDNVNIPLTTCPAGLYIVKAIVGNNVSTSKIVKN